jgi:hypothetical protein
VVSPDRVEHIG